MCIWDSTGGVWAFLEIRCKGWVYLRCVTGGFQVFRSRYRFIYMQRMYVSAGV